MSLCLWSLPLVRMSSSPHRPLSRSRTERGPCPPLPHGGEGLAVGRHRGESRCGSLPGPAAGLAAGRRE
eukprot:11156505-Lingulodinium_polyedra.AAC.1